jgi:hypothetical protein
MYVYFLLVVVGACWIGGVAGAVLWWNARRSLIGGHGVSNGDPEALSPARKLHDEPKERAAPCSIANEPDRGLTRRLTAEDGSTDQSGELVSASSLRFPYPQQQWAAPCTQGSLPAAEDFFTVQCSELYDEGVSFFTSGGWQSETLVISLGTRATTVFMLARVTDQRALSEDENSPASYLVDCRFIRRVREGTRDWLNALRSMEPLEASAT